MKLLFDQNVSPRLVDRLVDLFPDSAHVFDLELDSSPDDEVWVYARDHGFTIVTKDVDYNELSLIRGWPPKVIWLRLGNCTTAEIERVFRRHIAAIERLDRDPAVGTLTITSN
ncbi:MAG: DUF5615 family PIN-like protein [Planctomycetaceae bacterium]